VEGVVVAEGDVLVAVECALASVGSFSDSAPLPQEYSRAITLSSKMIVDVFLTTRRVLLLPDG
jgi:hypothetical protein